MATTRTSRLTGTHITRGTAEELGLDVDGGKWVVLCDEHSFLINTDTRATAEAMTPFDFCEPCQWLYGGETYTFTDRAADKLLSEYGERNL